MDVKTQMFLILNGTIIFFIVMFFWRRRPSSNLKRPANFKLSGSNESESENQNKSVLEVSEATKEASSYAHRAQQNFQSQQNSSKSHSKVHPFDISSFAEPHDELASDEATPVNVIFTWNGHAWDAFEVLGIPAGSSMVEVIKAYDDALKKVDPQSQEFIKKAYECICHKSKRAG